jgi:hypothetical protein
MSSVLYLGGKRDFGWVLMTTKMMVQKSSRARKANRTKFNSFIAIPLNLDMGGSFLYKVRDNPP